MSVNHGIAIQENQADKEQQIPPLLKEAAIDPLRWSKRKKWVNVILVSVQGTLPPVCSTFLAIGAAQVDQEFDVQIPNVSALPVALFVVGLGIGPLYLAPLSETRGRRIVYIVSFGLFSLFNIGCALVKNEPGLIVLRLLAGLAGSAGPSLGGGTIGDMFTREDRGTAQALYGLGPTLGPSLGGLIGGYIVSKAGWRWLMWVMAIASGITTILSILFLRETYYPYLLARSKGEKTASPQIGFTQSVTRPIRMLFTVPVVTVMSIYMAIGYGIFYLHLVTVPLLFGPVPRYGLFSYQWLHGDDGLAYLGVGIGCFISAFVSALTLNRSYRALANKYKASKPEFRMPFMQLGLVIMPIGLFIFGWTAQNKTHWTGPLFGAVTFAFGMLMTYICIQTYLVDSFGKYAASALAATTVSRSVIGGVFSLIGTQLYKNLGYGWGTTLLGFISATAIPIPVLLWFYGEKLRSKAFLG